MTYRHTFDRSEAGDIQFSKSKYSLVQQGLELLRDEIRVWNERALQHGAASAPYLEDLELLEAMISYGSEKLSDSTHFVLINRMSLGSLRYIKAGLILLLARREGGISEKEREGWPKGVLASMREGIKELAELAQGFDAQPADILEEINLGLGRAPATTAPDYDVFISHASEDKDFVRPLAERLSSCGLRVWIDEVNLTVGDSLNRKIAVALGRSRFGIVVISHNFLKKEWPQRELDGLTAREHDGSKVILPVWHGVDFQDVRKHSPMLADRLAVNTARGIDHVVEELLRAVEASAQEYEPSALVLKKPGTHNPDRPLDTSEERVESRSRAPHVAKWNLRKAEGYAHRKLKDGAAPGEVAARLEKHFDLPRQMAREVTEGQQREIGEVTPNPGQSSGRNR